MQWSPVVIVHQRSPVNADEFVYDDCCFILSSKFIYLLAQKALDVLAVGRKEAKYK